MDIVWTLMKWPAIACLVLPGPLVYLGLHIVRRGVIFVDLALAQVATLGTCVCLMLGHDIHDVHTFYWSVAFTLGGAFLFAFTRTRHETRVPQEALIGVVYVVAAAAAILFLSRTPEGNEELKRTLVGDILTVNSGEILKTIGLFAVIAVVHLIFRKRFLQISFQPEQTETLTWSIRWWDFLFYALFGAAVTSFVQIGGVLLVFSYLIVPALCGNLLARSLGWMLATGWAIAVLGGAGGLFASYQLDLPAGAAIVCTLGLLLIVTFVVSLGRRPGLDIRR